MSEPQQQITVMQLKAGAQVPVVIGAAFVQKIEKAFEDHIMDHEEELKALDEKKGKYDDLTPWENTTVLFSTLMQEIMRVAKEQDMIESVPLTSLTPSGQKVG